MRARAQRNWRAHEDARSASPHADAQAAEPELDDSPAAGEALAEPTTDAEAADALDPTYFDDPPFDPPDDEDVLGDDFAIASDPQVEAPAPNLVPCEPGAEQPLAPTAPVSATGVEATAAPAREPPAPPITIYASWDRPEIADLLTEFAADKRMARADITIARGGIEGALARLRAGAPSPHALILDTTLSSAEMLTSLDQLAGLVASDTKVIVIGGVNDITLFRDLVARGVTEYVIAPTRADEIVRRVCKLYAQADQSRVIAVIGARGGVGASTLAHNIAWSIAQRWEERTTLVDLDFCFGTAALDFNQQVTGPVEDFLAAADDDASVDRLSAEKGRLRILCAPAKLERALKVDPEAMRAALTRVRRASPYVVLDLPHAWNPWIKQTLRDADAVLVVAAPDLAGLRDTKNLLEALKGGRARAPVVALSMAGSPKRPEVTFKDFAEALGVAPAASFAFDPALYVEASVRGQMLGETAPASKPAVEIDALAAMLMGRDEEKARAARSTPRVAPERVLLLDERRVASASLDDARNAALARLKAEAAPRRQGRVMATALCALAMLAVVSTWYGQTHRANAAQPPGPAQTQDEPQTAAALYDRAVALMQTNEKREGVMLLYRAAEDGLPSAQYRLAKAYEQGEGVRADLTAARRWTERAAESGNQRAMHDAGVYAAQGEGGAQDEAAAFRWFQRAAELGLAESQFNLAVLLEQGRGAAADAQEALFWFEVAASQHNAEATARAAALANALPAGNVEQIRTRARAFKPRAPRAIASGEDAATAS